MAIHISGQAAPKTGQYLEIGARGEPKKEIAISKGETFPPTKTPGSFFKLMELGRNKNGSGK